MKDLLKLQKLIASSYDFLLIAEGKKRALKKY